MIGGDLDGREKVGLISFGSLGWGLLILLVIYIVVTQVQYDGDWDWGYLSNEASNNGNGNGNAPVYKKGNASQITGNNAISANEPNVVFTPVANGSTNGTVNGGVYQEGDCRVHEWGQWSDCSANCGGGVQTRTRSIWEKPTPGGAQCPPLIETRPCNEDVCAEDYVPEHLAVDDFVRYTGVVPKSQDILDVPNIPAGVDNYTGKLIQGSAEDCQRYCASDTECDLVQFRKSVSAFDGNSGCTLHMRHPESTSVTLRQDRDNILPDGSYMFDAYCAPDAQCRRTERMRSRY